MALGTAYGTAPPPAEPRTAFGELRVENLHPVIQMTGIYGLLSKVDAFEINGGTVSFDNSMFVCNSGSNTSGSGSAVSKKQVVYRAGQGILARLTALFDTPQPSSFQYAGLIQATDILAFAYQNEEFGIRYSHDGQNDIQELTITVAATGGENATVTVNGTAYTVPLTAGSVQHNAIEISASLNTQVPLYAFSATDDTVVARYLLSEPAGSFAFTSSSATASWASIQVGVVPTTDFIAQADWNLDPRPNLDVTKGNVYEIRYQFLGFGAITFSIEDEQTGAIKDVHVIRFANSNVIPSMTNPTFRVGWVAGNDANTTPVEIRGASAAIFNEGIVAVTETPRSISETTATVPTTVLTNIFTMRNRLVVGTKRNRAPTFLFTASGLTDSTKGAVITVIAGSPVFSGDLIFDYIDKDGSTTELATDTVTVTGGRVVATFPVSTLGGEVNLDELNVLLLPDETLTFAATVISGASSSVSVELNFVEDL